jgi:hypothetical protein
MWKLVVITCYMLRNHPDTRENVCMLTFVGTYLNAGISSSTLLIDCCVSYLHPRVTPITPRIVAHDTCLSPLSVGLSEYPQSSCITMCKPVQLELSVCLVVTTMSHLSSLTIVTIFPWEPSKIVNVISWLFNFVFAWSRHGLLLDIRQQTFRLALYEPASRFTQSTSMYPAHQRFYQRSLRARQALFHASSFNPCFDIVCLLIR